MSSLKKERSVMRGQFTKQANALEQLLESENVPGEECEIEIKACFKLLQNVFIQINELNKKIKQQILEKPDWVEKDLEEEIEGAGRYENKFAILQAYMEQRELSRASSEKTNEGQTCKTNEGQMSKTNENQAENKRKDKLPKLEAKKFDGKIKNWLNFWGSFSKIDTDKTLSQIDKMQYLQQLMEPDTDVQRFVNSFPLTDQSYSACLQDLKSRYARDDLLIQAYVREILAIILDNNERQLAILYDKLNSSLRSLEILGVTKDKFSAFLLPMVESALPSDTLKTWERLRPDTSDDMLNCLLNFLKKEIESEQRIAMAKSNFTPDLPKACEPTATCFSVNVKNKTSESSSRCVWCDKANHQSLECYKIAKMSLDDRREHLKKKRACALCLKTGHHAKICKSFVKCYVCGQRHSPVMCTGVPIKTVKSEKNEAEVTLQNLSQNNLKTTTLLQTVAVKIRRGNKAATVRALFDSGSQRSYIKKEIAQELGLPVTGHEQLSHSLFGGVSVSLQKYNVYDFTIESLDNTFKYNMSALEQLCVCKNVPKVDESHESLMRLLNKHNIKLSDSESSDIGLLIGANYSGALLTNLLINLENGLTAIKTKMGWTLQGKINITNNNVVTSLFCSDSFSNFWDLELLGINDPTQVQSKQQKEEEVMSNFEENIMINSEGRYEVHLPWKNGHDTLQSNQQLAMRRLETTSKKLKSCGKFQDYDNVFSEWEQAGIIEEVPETERDQNNVHYLAHRAVFKESSLTTKTRPVYDASSKDKNGLSLNLCLEKGINFLDKIPKLLISFRKGCIGITADIAKAFLQISVTPQDRDYLRFLWWKDESCDKIKVYRHRRVVFGLTASPFLLSATISHHLNQVTDYKATANLLGKSFYVDNLVTSLDSTEQTQIFIHEAKTIMNEGKFDLRQWVTAPLQINEAKMTVISVLGLLWDTATDELYCNLNSMTPCTDKITKRNLLSLTQKIFDPIGFTCPVTLVPRLILQQIWNSDISWDQELPIDIVVQFKNWYEQLECLNNCRLHRRLSSEPLENCTTSLHMYCNASKDGYAACVFLRSENSGKVTVRLVSAKSRITPPEKWIVLYTCAVYRAVHLELTQSLSTEAFLRTFRRFIARRGRVNVMISDNGSNFTGAKSLLNDIDWNEVQKQSSIQRIKWKLNAPTAAWWGGFFERLIKILKGLLRRVLGTSVLSYDELQTLICDCEAVMNNRPLTYVQDDSSNSLEPLTPSCFLQVHPSDATDIVQIDRTSLNIRLRYLQKLREDFKQRFKNEYLTTLVQNGTSQQDTIKVGDIVLIESEEKRVKWPLGLIIKTFTGNDGIVRSAQVKTTAGLKTRPIQRLYRLELSSSEVEGQREANTNDTIGKKFKIITNPSSSTQRLETSQEEEETTVSKTTRTGRVIKLPARYDV